MRILILTVFALLSAGKLCAEGVSPLPDHAVPVLQNWLSQNEDVVEVCVFREEWKSPTEQFPKGTLLRYGTIKRTHKGNLKVGDQLVMTAYVEFSRAELVDLPIDIPERFNGSVGELFVVMLTADESGKKNGYWDAGADISRFSFTNYFYRAFLLELERDSTLAGKSN